MQQNLEQSCFLKENYSITEGRPPEINLLNELNNGNSVLRLIEKKLVVSAHDLSNGGLLTALSEMCMGSEFGVKIHQPKKLRNIFEYFFGEDQGRYILEIDPKNIKKVKEFLEESNIYFENIGFIQKNYFEIEDQMKIGINDLYNINNEWYNNY